MHMIGEPERKPLKLAGHQASYAAGLTAFTGLMAALAARDTGRKAPAVRVSLAEVMQWVNWKAASGAAASGISPGREGRNSEFQVLPCRDGPCRRGLHGDPMAGDTGSDRRFPSRRSEVFHARRTASEHRRTLCRARAVVCRQDARGNPEGGAGEGCALRSDLLARRTAADRAIPGARLPGRDGASD